MNAIPKPEIVGFNMNPQAISVRDKAAMRVPYWRIATRPLLPNKKLENIVATICQPLSRIGMTLMSDFAV